MKFWYMKKSNLLFYFIFLIIFYVSFCVANKPDNLDNDYYVYFNAFNTGESKEITFSLITKFCKFFGLSFPYLLFFYCFTSLFIKSKIFVDVIFKRSILSFLFIVIIYLFCFFPLWEVTQIRASLAISIFIYGIFCVKSNKNKYFLFIISLLFHNSMFVLIGFYILINLAYRYRGLAFVLSLILIFVAQKIIGLTEYDVYSSSSWGEQYNLVSFKNFYILLTNILLLYYLLKDKEQNQFKINLFNLTVLNFVLFIFCIYLGFSYPSVSIRFSDMLLFNTIFALSCFKDILYLKIYKLITIAILVPYFLTIFFFGSDPIFNFNRFMSLFL